MLADTKSARSLDWMLQSTLVARIVSLLLKVDIINRYDTSQPSSQTMWWPHSCESPSSEPVYDSWNSVSEAYRWQGNCCVSQKGFVPLRPPHPSSLANVVWVITINPVIEGRGRCPDMEALLAWETSSPRKCSFPASKWIIIGPPFITYWYFELHAQNHRWIGITSSE